METQPFKTGVFPPLYPPQHGLYRDNGSLLQMPLSSNTSPSTSAVLAIVPARYGSLRFPGKPLVEIAGLPMVVRAWQQAQAAVKTLDGQAIVATDDTRIVAAVKAAGGQACMTRNDHPTGTDRLWEVAQAYPDAQIIVNVQGDEPFIQPAIIQAAINGLATHPEWDMATLITPLEEEDETNPNAVKAIVTPLANKQDLYRALYFSRLPAPYARYTRQLPLFRHLGLYVYRRAALEAFVSWPPSPLEQTESLEQLRALENGLTLGAVCIPQAPLGVDTPEDVARVEAWAHQQGLV